jgi:hypothetical protein
MAALAAEAQEQKVLKTNSDNDPKTTIVIGAYLSERVPANFRGRIYGVTNFAAAFMSGVVEWGSGRLFDDYGLKYAWAFSIGMTMVAVIASCVLIYTDRKEFSNLYAEVKE